MEKFIRKEGLVAPLDRANVDTDAIIPKQFLKSIQRTGFGPNLFDEWRYLDPGEPGQDPASRKPNPDFVLNQPRYQGASVLVAQLFDEVAAFPGYRMSVDLPRQVVVKPDGAEIPFDVQPFRKYCLVNG